MKRLSILFLFVFSCITAFATVSNGSCGENATWRFEDDGSLYIEGTGEMENYKEKTAPWYKDYYRKIFRIKISDGITNIGDFSFYGCSSSTSVVLPSSLKRIGKHAFEFCIDLSSVKIPASVTTIGEYAFASCHYLTSVHIPDSVIYIGDAAFSWCHTLVSVHISASVTSIGEYTFHRCEQLDSVNIPNSVTSIGDWAFNECSGLTSVNIPNSVTSIGNYSFAGCSSLTSVDIPNSVISIGEYAFVGCEDLSSVHIPNSVTNIGEAAFYDCRSIVSVTIPSSVTNIGDGAFEGCDSLKSLTCEASMVPTAGYDTFKGSAYRTGTLYVPAESIDKYSNVYPWNGWGKIMAIEDVPDADKCGIPSIVYSDSELSFSSSTPETMVLYFTDGRVNVENAPANSLVSIYTLGGELYETKRVSEMTTTFQLPRNNIYIFKIAEKTFKVKI